MPNLLLRDYCFAHQPILDAAHRTVAVELLYRDPDPEGVSDDSFDHTSATANVIANAFSHIGMMELIGHRKLFINIAADLLLSDTITLLPSDKVTLELLEHIEVNEAIVERVKTLKSMGYSFALDDYVFSDTPCPLFDLVDIIKVDVLHVAPDALQTLVDYLRQWPCQLLAEKVESEAMFHACKMAGFDLFQGYYFAHPARIAGRLTDPSKVAVLDLMTKIGRDVDPREIEAAVKANPGLTYNLFRLASSPAFYRQAKIESVRQTLQLLGMRQLSRWLQVMLFTKQQDQAGCALLEMALHRALLMESMANVLHLPADPAYTTGMLSLADSALGVSLDKIIDPLNLVDPVHQALVSRGGDLGRMLDLCEALENGHFLLVADLVDELGIPMKQLMALQARAISQTNQLIHDFLEPHPGHSPMPNPVHADSAL